MRVSQGTMESTRVFTLLIADDEPMIRNGLAENVPWTSLGFEVLATCEDGSEVIAWCRSNHVDAILADIEMPGVSGIELAEVIKHEAPATFVLFLTAHSDFIYAQAAIEHGVWRYLVKPVNYAELLETIRELHQEILAKRAAEPLRASVEGHKDPLVREVEEYLQCHFRHATLSEISRHLGLTPEHVSRVYSQRGGHHFSDRLQEIRMTEASRLLKQTRYRVGEISDIVGYSNPKNFTRCFHKRFGISPRQYRLDST